MTYAQMIARLQEIRSQMGRIAAMTTPSEADDAIFRELAAEFDTVDAQRLAHERQTMLARVQSGEYGTERGSGGHGDTPSHARADDADRLLVRRDESIAAWARRNGRPMPTRERPLSLGRILRGLGTGEWAGAEAEMRAMAENPASAGGYLLPVDVSSAIIDRARAIARVLQAGAQVAPMTTATLKIPRLATGVTPAWRAENTPIAESGATLDAVTLNAKSLAVLVRSSFELDEDTDVEGVLEAEFAAAFALALDRAALVGSGVDPEPRGLRNQTGVTVTSLATNGRPITYDDLIDAVQVVRSANYEPSGVLGAPRTASSLSKLKDSAGAYLAQPPALDNLPLWTTNQVGVTDTQGTASNASTAFVGDWSKLVLGVRTSFRVRRLDERYADSGQVGWIADLRADVAVTQPAAFNIITGVTP